MSYLLSLGLWATVLFAFDSVFADRGWLPLAALAAFLALTIEYASFVGSRRAAPNRQRWIRLGALLAHFVGFVFLIGWAAYPETLASGIPTKSTLDAIYAGISSGQALLAESPAPVDAHTAIVVIAAGVIWLSAAVSGAVTWAVETPALGVVLPLAISVFSYVYAHASPSLAGIALFVILAAAMVAAADFEKRRLRPRAAQLIAPFAAIAAAAVAGVFLAPQIPGWGEQPLVDYGNIVGTRIRDNPLVDIRPRIVDQSTATVFEVSSFGSSYWRLTSLDEFNGRIWERSGRAPELANPDEAAGRREFVTIIELSSPWLPVAPFPTRHPEDTEIDAGTNSLVVPDKTRNGHRYEVMSAPPEPTVAALDASPAVDGIGPTGHYLRLPELPKTVRAWTDNVTADTQTPFAAAIAIQEELRTYEYDISTEPGHGESDLETFLLQTRKGYCEQFAAAMAVAARLEGIPSRVAVGYLPGTLVDAPSETFAVAGKDSHAWPELYFEGAGWLAFEPTPSRGTLTAAYLPNTLRGADSTTEGATDPSGRSAAGGESSANAQGSGGAGAGSSAGDGTSGEAGSEAGGNAGNSGSQGSGAQGPGGETGAGESGGAATGGEGGSVPGGGSAQGGSGGNVPGGDGVPGTGNAGGSGGDAQSDADDTFGVTGPTDGSGGNRVLEIAALVVLGAAVLFGAAIGATGGVKAVRRRRRRKRGAGGAWAEVLDHLRDLDVRVPPGSTPLETAQIARREGFVVDDVAARFTISAFSPTAPADDARAAWTACDAAWQKFKTDNPKRARKALFSLESLRPARAPATAKPKRSESKDPNKANPKAPPATARAKESV